jgi:hypothetical protein
MESPPAKQLQVEQAFALLARAAAQLEPVRPVPKGKMQTCHFKAQKKLYVKQRSVTTFDQHML